MVTLKNKSLQIASSVPWMNMIGAFIYFDTKRDQIKREIEEGRKAVVYFQYK